MDNGLLFDKLKMYFGEPLIVNEFLTVRQPTIGDIIDMGEANYYRVLNNLTASPEKMISVLWDMGIDWEQISEFDLFILMTRGLSVDDTRIFFGEEVDLSTMVPVLDKETNRKLLIHAEDMGKETLSHLVIDELVYQKIANFLRQMHKITVKRKRAANARTKRLMIQMDRSERAVAARTANENDGLYNMISFALNCPGFKYKKSELKQCGVVEFYDSIERLSIIFQTDAALKGVYGGMVSAKDIGRENLNYMRSATPSEE